MGLSVAIGTTAFATSPENFDVIVRTPRGKAKIESRPIEGLKSSGIFETENFKVVWKKEEAALTLDRIKQIIKEKKSSEKENDLWIDRDPERIRLMAANVLYHAERARRFFIDVLHSEEVLNLEPVVIRLDLTNTYSEYDRFANDRYRPQFNNALSIQGGTPYKPKPDSKPWGREIWFRPEKKIPITEILAKLPEDPANAQLRAARAELYPMQIDLAIRNTLYAAFQSRLDSQGYIESMTRQAGTFLLMEGAFQILKLVNRALIPKYFYLDSALVPEIIYHEFSHIALSDSMRLDVSTPVNEGMADFFAANIGNDPQLARKIRKYSTGVSKNGKKRQFFQVELESLGHAQSDFVLSLLWGLREVIGEARTLKLVFDARKFLDTKDSDIRIGLLRALFLSCEKNCESPMRDRLLIHQYLQDRGL